MPWWMVLLLVLGGILTGLGIGYILLVWYIKDMFR